MTDVVTGLMVGFMVGVVVLSVLMFVSVRRTRRESFGRMTSQDEMIIDLRQELAEDKETNRRLRHQLHSASLRNDGFEGRDVEIEALQKRLNLVLAERDEILSELSEVRMILERTRSRLIDRESKLTKYRSAVKQIQLSMQGQHPLGEIISVTQDISVAQDVSVNASVGE